MTPAAAWLYIMMLTMLADVLLLTIGLRHKRKQHKKDE